MSSVPRHHRLTLDDYFAVERRSPERHEYFEGQVFLMAGGTPRHNYLESRASEALGRRLGGSPCFTMTSNQRIATHDGLYTYADGSVFCGRIEVGEDQTALNPVVLIEVLSDKTRDYDRGEKLERYKTIPSLRHVLLIEQVRIDVEHWFRGAGGWQRRVYTDANDVIALGEPAVELTVGEIYEGVERIPA